jgi:membrane protein implicated in regulation of membrane protease activity
MMNELIQNNVIISWIIFGLFLIVAETFIIPGIGLLFAGLSAIATASLIYYNIISQTSYIIQFAAFFAITGIWAILLWKPIKRFHSKSKEDNYNNIIGTTAIIYHNDLLKGSLGQVKWSGTIMNARIADDETAQVIVKNTEVTIVATSGNNLIIKNIQ